MTKKNKQHGFTIAELLVVISIIAVLTAISVVVFNRKTEQARQAADMATMRTAYGLITIQYLTGENNIIADGNTRYFYDANTCAITTTSPTEGYGMSHTNSHIWWSGNGEAIGIPNTSSSGPEVLSLTIEADGTVHYYWGDTYTGQNVTTATQYLALTYEEKLAKDVALINAVQNEFRSMTYGEIHSIIYDSNGKKRAGFVTGKLKDGCFCVQTAYGYVDESGETQSSAYNAETNKVEESINIFFPEQYANAGFNTSLNNEETYLINSLAGYKNIIWLNVKMAESDFKNLTPSDSRWNQVASNAYTYVKSSTGSTPSELSEATRRNQ